MQSFRKLIESKKRSSELTQQQQLFFEQFKYKPFWIWDKQDHKFFAYVQKNGRRCCLNHIIGLPSKDGINHSPLSECQQEVVEDLEHSRRVWILKSGAIGVTTLLLRYMAWLLSR
jgi:hypothetical protein